MLRSFPLGALRCCGSWPIGNDLRGSKRRRSTVLDHASLGVADLERSRQFYDAALRPLGLVRLLDFEDRGSDYGSVPNPYGVEFTITVESQVCPLRGTHLALRAPDRV